MIAHNVPTPLKRLTLPAIRTLRGGALRVALGTALMYVAFDGSPQLILPNPIMPPPVAHAHAH